MGLLKKKKKSLSLFQTKIIWHRCLIFKSNLYTKSYVVSDVSNFSKQAFLYNIRVVHRSHMRAPIQDDSYQVENGFQKVSSRFSRLPRGLRRLAFTKKTQNKRTPRWDKNHCPLYDSVFYIHPMYKNSSSF